MTEPKIHISRAIWDEDTHEVAYIVDGVMTADVATQRKLNAVDDMYEALEDIINQAKKTKMPIPADLADSIHILGERALRKARGETE